MDDLDDTIARALAGDRRAFGVVFERYAAMVHGVLLARASSQEVDDLVQDVFETALVKLRTLREPAAIGAWLANIARNRAVDASRRRRRTEPIDEAVADEAATPSQRVEANRVLDAIRALPDAYQEPLVLRLACGMTGPEIAAQLGMTPGSVRVNLHRGMKLLTERLGIR
ncbi:MAG TPA: sigma-70 family RNA polymerase sigma factor [Labilithrix sp.]